MRLIYNDYISSSSSGSCLHWSIDSPPPPPTATQILVRKDQKSYFILKLYQKRQMCAMVTKVLINFRYVNGRYEMKLCRFLCCLLVLKIIDLSSSFVLAVLCDKTSSESIMLEMLESSWLADSNTVLGIPFWPIFDGEIKATVWMIEEEIRRCP